MNISKTQISSRMLLRLLLSRIPLLNTLQLTPLIKHLEKLIPFEHLIEIFKRRLRDALLNIRAPIHIIKIFHPLQFFASGLERRLILLFEHRVPIKALKIRVFLHLF